jgi:cyclic pyranopterin phosphate synthase
MLPDAAVTDRLGRPLRDLRISVTDRCNFRCRYCMPREVFGADHPFLPADRVLTLDEIERVSRAFVLHLGARKLRLTGGEPLLRRGLPDLVARLAAIDGVEDLALTTNGALLAAHAPALKAAGLRRVTVSLDALDDDRFRRITDAGLPVARVLAGIEAAQAAGLGPVKVNAVIQRGVNEDQIGPLVRHFRGSGCVVRFIEYMDVGSTNGWRADDVVPAAEIVRRVEEEAGVALVAEPPAYRGEVARRWRWADGSGEVGVIASVTQPFCRDCTRARLSAEGGVYTCLFAARPALDLLPLLRSGAPEEEIAAAVRATWSARTDRYSELRASRAALPVLPSTPAPKVEMSHIGG